MRISFITMQSSLVRQVDKQTEDLARLANESSSGLKLTTPSDDPLAYSQAMNITQTLSEYDNFSSNIKFATTWNETSDTAISNMIEQLQSAQTTAISAVNSTSDSTTADANVDAIEQVIEQMVSLANTQYDGRYLFGGTKDLGGSEAFTNSGSAVTYNGNDGDLVVRTGSGSSNSMTVNITGQDLVNYTGSSGSSTDIFTTLYNLKTAISSGDTTTIQTCEADLSLALDHLSGAESTVGTRLNRLDSQSSALDDLKTNKTSTLTDLQQADYTDVLTQLSQKKIAYSATMQVISTLSSLTLTNYL